MWHRNDSHILYMKAKGPLIWFIVKVWDSLRIKEKLFVVTHKRKGDEIRIYKVRKSG